MEFEFINLKCSIVYNNILEDYIIYIPEKKLKLSYNKILEFNTSGNAQIIGYNSDGTKCLIQSIQNYIEIGCVKIFDYEFKKQCLTIKKLLKCQN